VCAGSEAVPVTDLVNHPPHYGSHPSGVECIRITEHYNFNVGNAIKYLWRAGLKEGVDPVEDLKKAAWYVNREIERLSREEAGAVPDVGIERGATPHGVHDRHATAFSGQRS